MLFKVVADEVIKMAMMPKLKNCAQCGKIFTPVRNEKICRDCMIKQEEKEREVLQYVRDNPGISMKDAADATGVSDKFIKQMASQGLFVNLTLNDSFFYPCVKCGRPISRGTYCTDCLKSLRQETKKVAEQMHIRIKENEKMSTIERLDALAEREFERENKVIKRHFSRGLYEDIVSSRRG